MKRFLAAVILALVTSSVFAITYTPISLLNPAGSTNGQFITSSGPTTAPAWTTVTLSGLGGLAKANNLSDVASVSTARTNLGLGTAATVATGTSGATIPLLSTANTWTLAQAFTVRPTFNGNTPYDTGNLPIASYGLLANPLSQFASTSSAQLATVLSDETGSGFVVYSNSPIITTPNIQGVTNASAAASGFVGQLLTNTPATLACPASATQINLDSLSLTAGQWLVTGSTLFVGAASTTLTNLVSGLSTTSAALPGVPNYAQISAGGTAASTSMAMPAQFVNVSVTTTMFSVGQVTYASGSCTYATSIRALRVR